MGTPPGGCRHQRRRASKRNRSPIECVVYLYVVIYIMYILITYIHMYVFIGIIILYVWRYLTWTWEFLWWKFCRNSRNHLIFSQASAAGTAGNCTWHASDDQGQTIWGSWGSTMCVCVYIYRWSLKGPSLLKLVEKSVLYLFLRARKVDKQVELRVLYVHFPWCPVENPAQRIAAKHCKTVLSDDVFMTNKNLASC